MQYDKYFDGIDYHRKKYLTQPGWELSEGV